MEAEKEAEGMMDVISPHGPTGDDRASSGDALGGNGPRRKSGSYPVSNFDLEVLS